MEVTTAPDSSNFKIEVASCPGGKEAISGGAMTGGALFAVSLKSATFTVNTSGVRTGYGASAHETVPTDVGWTLTVQALCVDSPTSS
ncbi:MAG: hypothetical protein L0206_16310 [Actinobacteria bacterium]|nr:hypothetical protein [Actinomycetota bacterium]